MDRTEIKCMTCIFFSKQAKKDVCKRFPPDTSGLFRRTNWSEWCGEHKLSWVERNDE